MATVLESTPIRRAAAILSLQARQHMGSIAIHSCTHSECNSMRELFECGYVA